MRLGDIGAPVAALQRQLAAAGMAIPVDAVFGPATEAAVVALQRRAGLVADGIAGPKTLAALASRDRDSRLLAEADLERAADRLGVHLAAIKAVNAVESRGRGFLDDGRPVILFERHVLYRLWVDAGGEDADAIAARYPAVFNPRRGGYVGGAGEWSRLASARQITADTGLAEQACSWGQYQIMGYHWRQIGYASPQAFAAAIAHSEAEQLAAFVAYLLSEPALHKALKGRKWGEFARLYNGPDYKANLYDVKLARAYERFLPAPVEAAS